MANRNLVIKDLKANSNNYAAIRLNRWNYTGFLTEKLLYVETLKQLLDYHTRRSLPSPRKLCGRQAFLWRVCYNLPNYATLLKLKDPDTRHRFLDEAAISVF